MLCSIEELSFILETCNSYKLMNWQLSVGRLFSRLTVVTYAGSFDRIRNSK